MESIRVDANRSHLYRPRRLLSRLAVAAALLLVTAIWPWQAEATTLACSDATGWTSLAAPEAAESDQGQSSTRTALFTVASGWETPTTVYAGGGQGLYRSDDCAMTWTRIWEPASTPEGRILHPAKILAVGPEGYIYFGGERVHRIVASEDHGLSWHELGQDLVGPTALGVAPADPRTIYVFGRNYDRRPPVGLPIWRSTDGGATWEQRNINGPRGSHVVDPDDASTVYSVGQGVVLRSQDAAASYQSYAVYDPTAIPTGVIPSSGGAGFAALSGDGSRFWFVTYTGRIFRSGDRGLTWSRLADIPVDSPVRAVSAGALDPTTIFVVTERAELLVYREPDSVPAGEP